MIKMGLIGIHGLRKESITYKPKTCMYIIIKGKQNLRLNKKSIIR